jgi:hypothetical protein
VLTDRAEIEIISRALQSGMRNPKLSRAPFQRIFDDFLKSVRFRGAEVLDLGPGQWDFGVLARERGAEVWGVDNDPAVLDLGWYKLFNAIEGNLRQPSTFDPVGPFDGLFCKLSINAFWTTAGLEAQRRHVSELLSVAKPDAWIWIAPWNGIPGDFAGSSDDVLSWQQRAFEEQGCTSRFLSEKEAIYYGVHGTTANRILFTRNL